MRRRVPLPAALLAAGTACVLGSTPAAWAAPWADSATVTGTSVTASSVASPTASCGLLQLLSTQVKWSAVSGASGYRVHSGLGGGTVEDVGPSVTSKTFTAAGTGTFYVETLRSYGSTTWVSASSNRLSYTVVALSTGVCLPI